MNMRTEIDLCVDQYASDSESIKGHTSYLDNQNLQELKQRALNMNVIQFEEALAETCFLDFEFASFKQLMRTHGEDAAMATLGRMVWRRVQEGILRWDPTI